MLLYLTKIHCATVHDKDSLCSDMMKIHCVTDMMKIPCVTDMMKIPCVTDMM